MCERAGVECKSNHSLRATGASEMFGANLPEIFIQSRTGHCSLEALQLYERPSHEQHQAVSNVLTAAEPQRSFGDELTNIQSTAEPTGVVSMVENRSLTNSTLLSQYEHEHECSTIKKSVEEFDKLVTNVHIPY